MASAPNHLILTWLSCGAGAGLRAGEISRLRREHILERDDPTMIRVINGKGGRDRHVLVGPNLLQRLAPYMTMRGRLWDASPATVTNRITEHFRELGMPWTTHNLRHSYAGRLYQVSKDLRLVQDQLGHSNPATTAIYAGWSHRDGQASVATVDQMLTNYQRPDAA